jgi:hypothetical protein
LQLTIIVVSFQRLPSQQPNQPSLRPSPGRAVIPPVIFTRKNLQILLVSIWNLSTAFLILKPHEPVSWFSYSIWNASFICSYWIKCAFEAFPKWFAWMNVVQKWTNFVVFIIISTTSQKAIFLVLGL